MTETPSQRLRRIALEEQEFDAALARSDERYLAYSRIPRKWWVDKQLEDV